MALMCFVNNKSAISRMSSCEPRQIELQAENTGQVFLTIQWKEELLK